MFVPRVVQESRRQDLRLLILLIESYADYIPGEVTQSHTICTCLVWYKNRGAESSPTRVAEVLMPRYPGTAFTFNVCVPRVVQESRRYMYPVTRA